MEGKIVVRRLAKFSDFEGGDSWITYKENQALSKNTDQGNRKVATLPAKLSADKNEEGRVKMKLSRKQAMVKHPLLGKLPLIYSEGDKDKDANDKWRKHDR